MVKNNRSKKDLTFLESDFKGITDVFNYEESMRISGKMVTIRYQIYSVESIRIFTVILEGYSRIYPEKIPNVLGNIQDRSDILRGTTQTG